MSIALPFFNLQITSPWANPKADPSIKTAPINTAAGPESTSQQELTLNKKANSCPIYFEWAP